jgi:hypothetical protein
MPAASRAGTLSGVVKRGDRAHEYDIGVVVQLGLERRPVTSEVAGSSPVHPAFFREDENPSVEGFFLITRVEANVELVVEGT